MEQDVEKNEYYPELISRRGEITAWGLAAVCGAGWLIMVLSGGPVNPVLPVLTILFIFAGSGISLGNWMDRVTVLRTDPSGIEFHNGLRNVYLLWQDIQHVVVVSHKWGDKIYVIGEKTRFYFRKYGEVTVRGETKGRMGFVAGEEIFKLILEKTGLREVERTESEVYYSRE